MARSSVQESANLSLAPVRLAKYGNATSLAIKAVGAAQTTAASGQQQQLMYISVGAVVVIVAAGVYMMRRRKEAAEVKR